MDYIETGLFHDVSSAPPGPHSNFDGDLKKKNSSGRLLSSPCAGWCPQRSDNDTGSDSEKKDYQSILPSLAYRRNRPLRKGSRDQFHNFSIFFLFSFSLFFPFAATVPQCLLPWKRNAPRRYPGHARPVRQAADRVRWKGHTECARISYKRGQKAGARRATSQPSVQRSSGRQSTHPGATPERPLARPVRQSATDPLGNVSG